MGPEAQGKVSWPRTVELVRVGQRSHNTQSRVPAKLAEQRQRGIRPLAFEADVVRCWRLRIKADMGQHCDCGKCDPFSRFIPGQGSDGCAGKISVPDGTIRSDASKNE